MTQALFILQLAIQVAFALLAIRTVVSWVRQPDARHGNLALALTALTLVIVLSSLFGGSGVEAAGTGVGAGTAASAGISWGAAVGAAAGAT